MDFRKISIIIFFAQVGFFWSCDDDSSQTPTFRLDPCEIFAPTPDSLKYTIDYESPEIVYPDISQTPTFYSDEVIEIKWELPNESWNTELQILELDHPYECLDYKKFHELNNNFTAGYGNQYVHYFRLNQLYEPVKEPVYVAYRMRSTDIDSPQRYSAWTNVATFTMLPLSGLGKRIITVPYNFNFITEDLDEDYFSGVLEKTNYKLLDIANEFNLDYDKIRFVRPIEFKVNFITRGADGRVPFSRIIIGFEEEFEFNGVHHPFEVFASVHAGSYDENPVKGNLYFVGSGNFFSAMDEYNLKMVYKSEEQELGNTHEIEVLLTFEVFSEY